MKLNDKMVFMKSGKHVTMNDLKVGDGVVVDVSVAQTIKLGAARGKAAPATSAVQTHTTGT